ncbi:hypothetical protein A2U01_0038403, partial [Trifolium medium]|nr:hypothetical protein [Trifolium medium]
MVVLSCCQPCFPVPTRFVVIILFLFDSFVLFSVLGLLHGGGFCFLGMDAVVLLDVFIGSGDGSGGEGWCCDGWWLEVG